MVGGLESPESNWRPGDGPLDPARTSKQIARNFASVALTTTRIKLESMILRPVQKQGALVGQALAQGWFDLSVRQHGRSYLIASRSPPGQDPKLFAFF